MNKKSFPKRVIESFFGGYVHRLNTVDDKKPLMTTRPREVAVVGSGLAGLSAAVTLSLRGFRVHLFEKNSYLGGKIGAWPVQLPDGSSQIVEHGFHAFFPHYYNLNRLLDKLGLRNNFRSIGDYLVLALDGKKLSFQKTEKTPILNLLSLAKSGVYRYAQILKNPRLLGLIDLLRFDPQKTFERFDEISYERWSAALGLPSSMRLVFNSFSRAFFAAPEHMSTAELIKSFHSFFLSHDGGLIYDYPTDDYDTSFLKPITQFLQDHDATIQLSTPIESIRYRDGQFKVARQKFDAVVLAADVGAAAQILKNSPELLCHDSILGQQSGNLQTSKGYAVLRIWTDKKVNGTWPGFFITEHRKVLDSVTLYDQVENQSREWAEKSGGHVYELHCYAVPDSIVEREELQRCLLDEFYGYFPEMHQAQIVFSNLQWNRDFTSFHTGMYANRPKHQTAIPGFYLAGDWVKLPCPAMLMEAACTSGILCANEILKKEGLAEEALFSVPFKGLFA